MTTTTATVTTGVAEMIAAQIGNRAFAMMGASNLVGSDDRLQFKIGANCKNVTHVTVTLTSDDLYTVRFDKVTKIRFNVKSGNITGGNTKKLHEVAGVEVSQLRRIIEEGTGLYLSL